VFSIFPQPSKKGENSPMKKEVEVEATCFPVFTFLSPTI